MIRLVAKAALLALALAPQALANRGLLIERVEVDATLGSALLADGLDGERLRAAIGGAVAEGEASILESAYVATGVDHEAEIRSVHELIYPTGWAAAEVPTHVEGPVAAGTDLIVPASPQAFTMRQVGMVVKWECAVLGATPWTANTLDVLARAATGVASFGQGKNRATVPKFAAERWKTPEVRLPAERYELLAVQGVQDDPSRQVFVFGKTFVQVPPLAGEGKEARGVVLNVEMFDVSAVLFGEILAAAPQFTEWTEQREVVEAAVEGGDAKRVGSAIIAGRSGQRTKGGEVTEYRYPMSGDPAESPQKFTAPPADTSGLRTTKGVASVGMRQLGFGVEAQFEIEAGVVELDIAVERARHDRDVGYGQGKNRVSKPVFASDKLVTGVRLGAGADMLVGAITPREALTGAPVGDRRLLVFVRTELPGD